MLISYVIYLKFVDGYPGIGRKIEQQWNKELKTAVPVTNQQHYAD